MAEDNWQTSHFRQGIVAKINEAVATTNLATSKSASEMESHVFAKANSKEEYLGFIAKLILHVRDSKNKNNLQQHQMQQQQQQQQQQQHQQQQQNVGGDNSGGNNNAGGVGGNQQGGGGGNGMQDPINALQNLASHQGNRGPMQPHMMSMGGGGVGVGQMNMGGVGVVGPGGGGNPGVNNANMLQSLIHQRPGMQQQMQNMSQMQAARLGQQVPGQMGGNMQQQQPGGGGQMMPGMGGVGGGMGVGGGGGPGGPMNQMGVGGGGVGGVTMNNQPMGQMQMGMGGVGGGMGANQMGGMNAQQQQQQQMVNPNQMLMNRINVGPNSAGNNANALTPQQQMQLAQQQQQMNANAGGMAQQINPNAMGNNSMGGQQQNQQGGPQVQMSGSGVGPNINNQMAQMQQQLNNPGAGMPGNAMAGNQMNINQMMNMQQRKPEMMLNNNAAAFQPTGIVRPPMVNPQAQSQQQQQQQSQQFNPQFSKSPSPSAPSPAAAAAAVPGGLPHPPSHPSQMVASPAMAPSPQMPSMLGSGPQQRNVMAPSPNASINTPGQAVAVPSPLNPTEEKQYRDKYQQLTKYIEPLKRMIARIELDGKDSTEKLLKMNRLLELLGNPNHRVPLETLLKCEIALERMDFKNNFFVPPGGQLAAAKEHPITNLLLEAVSASLQSPMGNHSLQRTFRPCLEALFGPDIKNLPQPTKKRKLSANSETNAALSAQPCATLSSGDPDMSTTATATPVIQVPHVLQGEIARLDQKFKVSLDPSCLATSTGVIKLVCCLDDKHLPCVPPVSVVIPENYPMVAPACKLIEQEYNATPFLLRVQSALVARIAKLPHMHSLSHLLDTWEMSVRQACAPVPAVVVGGVATPVVQPSQTSVRLGV